MPTPGPQFQPVLPGMGLMTRRPAPKAVPAVTPHATSSGPMPGQLVMGVHDLARGRSHDLGFHRVPITSGPMAGGTRVASKGAEERPYEVDPHGYVQEGFGSPPSHDRAAGGVPYLDHAGQVGVHPAASDLYGTHGGRYASTMQEALDKEGSSATDMGITANTAKAHDQQVRAVRRHWNSQPLVQFPTSQLVHSTQEHDETEGDIDDRSGNYVTRRTTGGGTARANNQYGTGGRGMKLITAAPGATGEGRQRIEAIKADLASGGQIRKPIWMTKVNGRFFQLDGHHRMVAAREMGHTHVPVRLWDQDAENQA